MYRYDEYDQQLLDERVAQFRDQMSRHLAGELTRRTLRRAVSRAQAEVP